VSAWSSTPDHRPSWRRVLRETRALAASWRADLRTGALALAVQQVLTAAGLALAAYCVARAVRGASYSELSVWILVLVVVALPLVRLPWLSAAGFSSVANHVRVDQGHRIFDAVDRLDPLALDEHRSGEVAGIATHDLSAVAAYFATTLPTLIASAAMITATTVGLALLDWRLGALALASLVLGVALVGRAPRPRPDASVTDHAEIVDDVQGLRELVSHDALERALDELDRRDRHSDPVPSATRSWADRSSRWVGALTPVVVLAAAAGLAERHHLAPTLVLPIVGLATLASRAWTPLADSTARALDFVEAAGRIAAMSAGPFRARPEHGPVPASTEIELRGVGFAYRAGAPDAISDLTFAIPAGETVALVGPSGAGKSTTIKLVLRLLHPARGSITIGGHDLERLDETTLRAMIGYVPQDPFLFNTTIRENLRLGRPDATDAEVEAAARHAMAWEFIAGLPDGLDTMVGENANQLSGGQRQRLAIARAFVADRPILILDEPTSHLDVDTEAGLVDAMARLRRGRTTLVVAHRATTTAAADQVVRLDRGRLASRQGQASGASAGRRVVSSA
jgi:ATP-binding cassette, subfamily C, bacterial CydC